MSVAPKRPTKPKTTINRTFAQRPKTAMQPQNQAVDKNRQTQAKSTGRAQPMSMAQQRAAMDQLFREGSIPKPTGPARKARQVTPAEMARIEAVNKHRNTKRPPKQAVQIKPSASKIKGPTNAPLKSRRASAQARMAQRKASMMARRSK